jgi:hypothetical protein
VHLADGFARLSLIGMQTRMFARSLYRARPRTATITTFQRLWSMLRIPPINLIALVLVASMSLPAWGKDYFLTIGGGYAPTSNQVSLEKNVRFFQRLLADKYAGGVLHDIYFSDGASPLRDLQYHDPDFKVARANQLIADVFQQTRYLDYQYRDHEIPEQTGAASSANMDKWFAEDGAKLQSGDRLVVYVTAHGGRSTDKKRPGNTALYLWNSEKMLASELAERLDKLPEGVQVVLVMVQCYSGGFANTIFKQADPQKGLAAGDRCGFFATVHDRVAAGCTPDINEENYREYSSYFWSALGGETRTGETVGDADYDRDGVVSFAEAHAWSLINSTTIDISVKSSDAFLRSFSKQKDKDHPELLSADSPLEELRRTASPADAAVVDALSAELELTGGGQRAKAARALADSIKKEKAKVGKELRGKRAAYNKAMSQIRRDVLRRWPELSNRWHPVAAKVLTDESDELVQLIEHHRAFKQSESLHPEIEKLAKQSLDLDRRWVKCQRLIRTLENMALSANLSDVADSKTVDRYQRLLALEGGTLGDARAATTAAAGE